MGRRVMPAHRRQCAAVSGDRVNSVDFPTFGLPTMTTEADARERHYIHDNN